jgi:carbamate kinase
MKKIALCAFGGNALLPDDQNGSQDEQFKNAQDAAKFMVHIIKKGFDLIIVHGNGPQVGNLLIQMEESIGIIPPLTLEVCDAMTEGSMGYMLEKSLRNELRKNSIEKDIATIVTQVVVDESDPAFQNPTKPVGPFYSKSRMDELIKEKDWIIVEDSGRGYRRVVPSPRPIDIVPKKILHDLVFSGHIVFVAGGGGIPVIVDENGFLKGIEAVIDKDYSASLIAREVGADLFIILTNVPKIFLNFGKQNEKPIKSMSVDEARRYLAEGQFPPGSMGPKVRAAIEYIENGGSEVLITSAKFLQEALAGKSGTIITRNQFMMGNNV